MTSFVGYPVLHPGSTETEGESIAHLKAKVDAGADFVITQLFYDTDRFIRWKTRAEQAGEVFRHPLAKNGSNVFLQASPSPSSHQSISTACV